MKPSIELLIDNRTDDKISIPDELEDAALYCLEEEGLEGEFEISLSLVAEEEIQELNRNFRGVDRVTDVLSFPTSYDEYESILGDVVICVKRAVQQAEEFGHSLKRELLYLFVHSMFHLLGYDHEQEDDKMEMREKEKTIMKKLGVFKSDSQQDQ